ALSEGTQMKINTEKVAAKQAATEAAQEDKEVPNVPLHFTELYNRVRQALIGETVIAIEWPRTLGVATGYTVFLAEIKDGGKVTKLPGFEAFARSRGFIQSCERPFGAGFEPVVS